MKKIVCMFLLLGIHTTEFGINLSGLKSCWNETSFSTKVLGGLAIGAGGVAIGATAGFYYFHSKEKQRTDQFEEEVLKQLGNQVKVNSESQRQINALREEKVELDKEIFGLKTKISTSRESAEKRYITIEEFRAFKEEAQLKRNALSNDFDIKLEAHKKEFGELGELNSRLQAAEDSVQKFEDFYALFDCSGEMDEKIEIFLTKQVRVLNTQCRNLVKQFGITVKKSEIRDFNQKLNVTKNSVAKCLGESAVRKDELDELEKSHVKVVALAQHLTLQLPELADRVEKTEERVTFLNVLVTNVLERRLVSSTDDDRQYSPSFSETSGVDSSEQDSEAYSDDEAEDEVDSEGLSSQELIEEADSGNDEAQALFDVVKNSQAALIEYLGISVDPTPDDENLDLSVLE